MAGVARRFEQVDYPLSGDKSVTDMNAMHEPIIIIFIIFITKIQNPTKFKFLREFKFHLGHSNPTLK